MLYIENPIEPTVEILELNELSIIIRPYTKSIDLKLALEHVEFQGSSWQLDLQLKIWGIMAWEKQILGDRENMWDEIP